MLSSMFAKTLRDSLGGILWWSVGLGSLALLVGWLYPTIQQSYAALGQYLDTFPAAFKALFGLNQDIFSLQGWANIEFLLYLPLALAVGMIAAGSGVVAGEEDRHTMDLLMSQPVSRRQLIIEKSAAITLSALIVTTLVALLFIVGLLFVNLQVDTVALILATFNALPLALLMGAMAMFGAAFFPSRGVAVALSATILAASFFLNSFAEIVEPLKALRPLSLYYYYASSRPLLGTMEWGHVALLLGLTALFFGAALWAFERRELRV